MLYQHKYKPSGNVLHNTMETANNGKKNVYIASTAETIKKYFTMTKCLPTWRNIRLVLCGRVKKRKKAYCNMVYNKETKFGLRKQHFQIVRWKNL